MSGSRRLLTGLAVLFAAVCCPMVYIVSVGAGAFFWNLQDNSVFNQVTVEIDSPSAVQARTTFLFAVDITNISGTSVIVDSIDFYFGDEGIDISRSKPEYNEINSYFGWQSYIFERTLAAGESAVFEFAASAGSSGTYPVAVDVCIDSPTSCASLEGEVVVD